MKISKSDYDFICEAMGLYPQLSHASNIITKCRGKRSPKEEQALESLIPEYAKYLCKILKIKKHRKKTYLVQLKKDFYIQ